MQGFKGVFTGKTRPGRHGLQPGLFNCRAATVECVECGLPMFPIAETSETVTLECANRHRVVTALPADRATRVLIDNWIAKKGAQLHVQHERWERGEDEE